MTFFKCRVPKAIVKMLFYLLLAHDIALDGQWLHIPVQLIIRLLIEPLSEKWLLALTGLQYSESRVL
jgi:hypothetical protein